MVKEDKRVCVVVLGDVGRSPRIQYHALSFAKEDFLVDLVGYGGSEPIDELKTNPRVKIRNLVLCPDFQKWTPQLLAYILKTLWQSITLFLALLFKRRSDYLLVQNPPAIPTLAVCWVYTCLVQCDFIIDWHNYGYTILELSIGRKNLLVRISKLLEGFFGRRAKGNLCVTKAMKTDLERRWGITAVTLYDRPPENFRPITLEEKHDLYIHLSKDYPLFSTTVPDVTVFTERFADGRIVLREDRPAVLMSSTSWTEDEDFSTLMFALEEYEEARQNCPTEFPQLICVITGKGPLKEHYCKKIAKKEWQHVEVCTPWLEPECYPWLVASADLGVCLHTSSSGLDLPMKVVDMFGCGLPVMAYDFPCLSELVKHKENSLRFGDAAELSYQLQHWFSGFPKNKRQQDTCAKFKKELEIFQNLRWHENWKLHALPLFQQNKGSPSNKH